MGGLAESLQHSNDEIGSPVTGVVLSDGVIYPIISIAFGGERSAV